MLNVLVAPRQSLDLPVLMVISPSFALGKCLEQYFKLLLSVRLQ